MGGVGDGWVFVDFWYDPFPTVELPEVKTVPVRFGFDLKLIGSLVKRVAGIVVGGFVFVAVVGDCLPLVPDCESISMDSW